MDALPDNERAEEYRSLLTSLSTQPVVNLTGFTNTDLKLEYGTANITCLTEYDQNYTLLENMEQLLEFDLPVLVGASRKSMIFKLFGTTPAEALNGTTVINTISLMKGASILRVHDVRECVEAVRIYRKCRENK